MKTAWQVCSVNCGSRCVLKLHVEDGVIRWVESDDLPEGSHCPDHTQSDAEGERTDSPGPQMRACLRGRSMKNFLDAPTRLDYPMKRVGRRGEGLFERISWDEALDTVAREIKRVVETYGNDAVLIPYGTGLHPAEGSPFERLMNSYGGYLGVYSDYSSAQLQQAMLYTYGDDGYYTGSVFSEAASSDMVVLFGNSPADTRMGGASAGWEFLQAREKGSFKLVSIDPRHSEVLAGAGGEWIPIRPGTDAAFVAGVAYVLITENLVDQEFLDRYCVGYDASTLPAGAPQNASYKDYILGMGPDGIAKTPAWASVITGAPRARIASFAREIAAAKRLFVAQGWGPQRHEMGELSARAILMLPLLTGSLGLPGTNSGARERFLPFVVPEPFVGENPVKAKIPAFMWLEAVKRGTELTSKNAGVIGAESLKAPVKLIINHAGNCLTNQHADINATHDVLADESLCEFIVVCDIHLTDSARYADILLPDVARAEQANLVSSGSADITRALVLGEDWDAWRADRMPAHEIAAHLADRLDVRTSYEAVAVADLKNPPANEASAEHPTDRARLDRAHADQASLKLSHDQRVSVAVGNEAQIPPTELPTWDHLEKERVWRRSYEGATIAYADFRKDPESNPLPTPSGKIEIYSERLAKLAETLEYDADQVVHPLPVYAPGSEGFESALRDEFPFQVTGYHCRQRTHSTFGSVKTLDDVSPQTVLINTDDAKKLGIQSGERLLIENKRGSLVITARVTPRIMPGVLGIPQGAWHEADMQGNRVDFGGCINTLTSARPTPLARGNAQHSILAKARKISREEEEQLRGSFRLPAVERLPRTDEEAGEGERTQAAPNALRTGTKASKRAKGTGQAGKNRLPQYGFRFIQSRCNGCKTCEIACKDYHGLEQEIALRTIYEYAGGSWKQDEDGAWEQDVFCYHLSMSCNHCSNPVCVRFCPVEAIKKQPGGFVVIDHDNCGGCQSCMIACPYHAPRFDEIRGVPVKCDGCHDRVLAGKQPICVEACPQRALQFGVYADMARGADHVSNMDPLPDSNLTQPNFAINPSAVALASQGREGFVVNIREA